jgi:carboxypeptidase family protein
MSGQRIVRFAIVFGSMFVPAVVSAQTALGGVAGAVRDTTGAVLPGVTVEAASPALIEKVRTVVTDGQGQYKIVDLRPGTYTVTFTLTGFSTLKREGLELNAAFTATVNAELRVGSLEETVTVTGASPVVDTQSSKTQNVLTREVLDAIPTGRNFQGFMALTLGAVSTGGGGGYTRDVGGDKSENVYAYAIHGGTPGLTIVDGLRVHGLIYGAVHRYAVNQLGVQEVVLETSGVSAEGGSGGLNVNMVSKDGGNTFSGVFDGGGTGKALQGSNLNDKLRARGLTRPNSAKKIWDLGVGVGGPILRNKLWFYTAHRTWGSQVEYAGVYFNKLPHETLFYEPDLSRPGFTDNYQRDSGLRLTWQATSKQKIALSANFQKFCYCYFYGTQERGPHAPEATYDLRVHPNHVLQATWTYPATNRLLIEAAANYRPDRQLSGRPKDTSPTARSVVELSTGLEYGSLMPQVNGVAGFTWFDSYGDLGTSKNYESRVAVSYITGSHAFKTGLTTLSGYAPVDGHPNYNVGYQFRDRVPVGLLQVAAPNFFTTNLKVDLGIFAQDQWTIRRLTLNLGVRYDYLNAYNPAQTRPAGEFTPAFEFAPVYDVPNWKDVSPRVGGAFDLFGNGKTALKGSVSGYVNYETIALARSNSDALKIAYVTNRTWDDANGNYVPDCDLKSPLANVECGPMSNQAFGTKIPTTQYADDVTRGWGVRPGFWQASAAFQHELRPRIGLTVAYFRTWYRKLTITDNRAIAPGDFDSYSLTAPVDPRLPGGGGFALTELYDIKPTAFGKVDSLVTQAEHFGKYTQVFNGVDVTINARLGRAQVSGGMSTGRTETDRCFAVDSPQERRFCNQVFPWSAQTQVKFSGVYQLPWNFQASATLQNLPGLLISPVSVFTNAQIAPSLGRNLGSCRGAAVCSATVVLPLLRPYAMNEPRETQLDVRLARTLRLAGVRVQPRFEVFNLFNAATVLRETFTVGPEFLRPLDILGARLFKFGAQVDF